MILSFNKTCLNNKPKNTQSQVSSYLLSHQDEIRDKVYHLKPSVRRVFTYLYRYLIRYKTVDISQNRIARHMGYCRQTVNEAAQELADLGLIIKITRGPKGQDNWQTCLYILNDAFKDYGFRSSLWSVFKILRLSCLLLLPFYNSSQIAVSKNPTLMNKGYIYNKKTWHKYQKVNGKFTTKEEREEMQRESERAIVRREYNVGELKRVEREHKENLEILANERIEKKIENIGKLQEARNPFACYAIKAIENGLFE